LSEEMYKWKQLGAQQRSAIYSENLVDFQEKLDIANQIASALEYLHERDIIYRDLKPDNIGLKNLLGGRYIVQLFDFGLCREIPESSPMEDKVFHMSGVGTRRYMSPEVFLGRHYNLKADVYSWAVVFHSMITLQRPFEMHDAEMHKLLVCQEGVRPTIFKEWPWQIQQLMRQGWAAQASERPSMKKICSITEGLLRHIECHNIDGTRRFGYSGSDTVEDRDSSPTPRASTENTFADFIETWTQRLCSGMCFAQTLGAEETPKGTEREASILFRNLEADVVTGTTGV